MRLLPLRRVLRSVAAIFFAILSAPLLLGDPAFLR
jgi:hypothetical protein